MIAGDAAEVATTIVEWLDAGDVPPSGFRSPVMRDRLAAQLTETDNVTAAPTPGTVELRSAIRRLDAAVPENRIYVSDPGRHAAVSWPAVHVYGAIGTGVPVAIGAGYADPARPVLLVGGDGGFMLGGLTEFNTAVRYGIDLIAVICNDGSYGPEHQMLVQWGHSPKIVEFDWPDLGPVARALGGEGITVCSEADLDRACQMIPQRHGPLLIDLRLDPYRVPALDH
jgi:thiamine pyrophosphate-dependent acetolactate synthase large subunit-like protein